MFQFLAKGSEQINTNMHLKAGNTGDVQCFDYFAKIFSLIAHVFLNLICNSTAKHLLILCLQPQKKVCYPNQNIGQFLYINFCSLYIQLFLFSLFSLLP